MINPNQMMAKPTRRVRVKGSWYRNIPNRNCTVGAMYCRIPNNVSGIDRADRPNNNRGRAVTIPAKAGRRVTFHPR
jgi:hypothetical protein